jgi:hypothetical protein
MRIEHWRTMEFGLGGDVYGHETRPDGCTITTSAIDEIEDVDGEHVVTTRTGSRYVLGAADPIMRHDGQRSTDPVERVRELVDLNRQRREGGSACG